MSLSKKFLGFVFAIVMLLMVVSAGVVNAHEFRTGDNVTTSQTEIIDETLFAFGTNLDISSEVNGDVICAAQNVNISGNVNGDVICAAQTINLTGNVNGDIRLAAQTVTLVGKVDGNASIVSQTFTSQSGGVIAGDVSVASEFVTIGGPVGRDVAVAASNVVITNNIGRNLSGSVEKLELTSSAVVAGNIEYTSNDEIVLSPEAEVGGEIVRSQPESKRADGATVFGIAVVWFIYLFIAMLITSMAIALLFPSVLSLTTNRAVISPWKVLLTGFLASIVMPVVLIVLGITIVGIPLMIILALIWLVIIMLSGPFTAYYLGRLALSNNRSVLLTMFTGSVLLLALYFIPFVGFFALIGAYWLGMGMIILELMRRTPKPEYSLATQEKIGKEINPKDKQKSKISSKPKRKNKTTLK